MIYKVNKLKKKYAIRVSEWTLLNGVPTQLGM